MIFRAAGQLQHMQHVKVQVGNTEITRVENYKYLAMKLDTRLIFSDHISYTKGKTLPKIKLLGRLNNILDADTLLMLYKAIIVPIFDYGDVIYHNLNQKDAIALQMFDLIWSCLFHLVLQCTDYRI